jgi:c(7)-type cytochrome triheme protein
MPQTPAQNLRRSHALKARRGLLAFLLIAGSAGFILAAACNSRESSTPPTPQSQPTQAQIPGLGPRSTLEQNTGIDFSRFSHTNSPHARLSCLLCHRREANSTQIERPGHTPCASCHSQQFNDASSAICTICHVDARSGNTRLKPAPRLSSFTAEFDHAKHTNAACAACHRSVNRGVALSIPSGDRAHATCFQCHSPRAESQGRDISSCGTCHKTGSHDRASVFTRAYKFNFSHAEHGSRRGLRCNDCHRIRAVSGEGDQVSAPAPLMHRALGRAQSCQTCHNNKRAFGEDFASCKRCHQGATFSF